MESVKKRKIIAIYGNTKSRGRSEYAINLAVAFSLTTKAGVLLIDFRSDKDSVVKLLKPEENISKEVILRTDIGIDILSLNKIKTEKLGQATSEYGYVVANVPDAPSDVLSGIFTISDSVHFFADSTKENLGSIPVFLEGFEGAGIGRVSDKLKVVVNRLNVFDKLSVEEMTWLARRNIWAVVPEAGILNPPVSQYGNPTVMEFPDTEYAKAIFYIAKSESEKLVGLALGSGAAFGLAHIGVLRVLERHKIPIDIVSGSSIGALIAAMFGSGFSSDKIEVIAKRLKNKLNIMRLLDFVIPVSGILAGKRLKSFLKDILGEKTFEDLGIPVKIMVYDLANRETITVEKGSLVEAVYKSISVPGIFKPSVERDRVIIDGGISDPVPVDALFKRGIKKVIAVNVMPGPEDVRERNVILKKLMEEEEKRWNSGPFYLKPGLWLRRFLRKVFTPNIFDVIMTSMQAMEYMLAENSCKEADIVLRPVFKNATSVDFHLARNFIKSGEEEASAHIEAIKELITK